LRNTFVVSKPPVLTKVFPKILSYLKIPFLEYWPSSRNSPVQCSLSIDILIFFKKIIVGKFLVSLKMTCEWMRAWTSYRAQLWPSWKQMTKVVRDIGWWNISQKAAFHGMMFVKKLNYWPSWEIESFHSPCYWQ